MGRVGNRTRICEFSGSEAWIRTRNRAAYEAVHLPLIVPRKSVERNRASTLYTCGLLLGILGVHPIFNPSRCRHLDAPTSDIWQLACMWIRTTPRCVSNACYHYTSTIYLCNLPRTNLPSIVFANLCQFVFLMPYQLTTWGTSKDIGAGDEIRTRDTFVGNEKLYH